MTAVTNQLAAALQLLLERNDHPPKRNCSCHITPPCGDCVEWGGLREAIEEAEAALSAHSQAETENYAPPHPCQAGKPPSCWYCDSEAMPVKGDEWDTLQREWCIDGMPADKQRLARAAFVAGAAGAVSGQVMVNMGDSEAEYIRANDEEAALAARQPVGEPVAVVGADFGLFWIGSGPIAPLVERNGLRPGSKLYAAPTAQAVDQQYVDAALHYGAHANRMRLVLKNARACIEAWSHPAIIEHSKRKILGQIDEVLDAYAKREPLPEVATGQTWQLQLADALDCAWNPAIQAERDGLGTGSALARGLAAVAQRLREHAAGEVTP